MTDNEPIELIDYKGPQAWWTYGWSGPVIAIALSGLAWWLVFAVTGYLFRHISLGLRWLA